MTFGYCATCRIKLKITHVRYTDTSAIRRKRCLHCDAKTVTDEIARSRLAQLLSAEQELITLKGSIASPIASDDELHESELNEEGELLLARMKKGFNSGKSKAQTAEEYNARLDKDLMQNAKPEPVSDGLNDLVRKLMPPGTI